MPSPFPGMDPFLERPGRWREVHASFLIETRYALAGTLPPGYEVRAESDLYLHELPGDPRPRRRVADDAVTFSGGFSGAAASGGAALAEPPLRTRLMPRVEERQQLFLEIVDEGGDEVVTVIELLSRANKVNHRDQYLAKRDELLHSPTHLIEIDLLRDGRPHELGDTADGPVEPSTAYRYFVSRADERPAAGVWEIGSRDALPVLPVPLRGGDGVTLDVRAVLDAVYDKSLYARTIYRFPPDPPLTGDDAAWAAELLATAGLPLPPDFPPPAGPTD